MLRAQPNGIHRTCATRIDSHHGYHLSEIWRGAHFGEHTEMLAWSGTDVAQRQSRNYRRRQRRVVIAVALATLVAAMLLAIAFFAVMRNATG